MSLEDNIVVIEDTRERIPLLITRFPVERGGIRMEPGQPRPGKDFEYPEKGLPVGDYSLKYFHTWTNPGITIERKSLDDLCGSLGKGRARFFREIEKMRQFRFRALVIEATEAQMDQHDYRSLIEPASVFGTLDALAVRTNLHVFWCGDPEGTARKVEQLIWFFARGIEKDWKLLEGKK